MFPRGFSGPALALCVPLLLPIGMVGAAWFGPSPDARLVEARALESDFLKEFKKHLAAQNTAEMQKLVKGETAEAVIAVVEVAEAIAAGPSEELETLHAALRDAWKAVHKTEFAEKVYRFFSNINASTKKNLADLKKNAEPGLREWERNQEKKDAQTFDLVEAKLRDFIDYFDQEGDLYRASELAAICARSMDEALRPGGDLHLAYTYYARALEYRTQLDLKDGVFEECTKRKAALAARGFDKKKGGAPEPADPGGAPVPPKPEKPVSTAPLKVPLTFEVVGTFDAFQRPTYYADDIFEIWNGIPLEKRSGDKGTFTQMGSSSPTFQRFGATDVKLDVDGDGKMDEKVPLTGNIVPIKITLGKGDQARPWAFLVVTGQQQSIYQGMQVNLAPVDEQTTLLTLGAASVVGDVGGTKVRIIDETFDALYGSRPKTYGFVGISDRDDPAKERLCFQPDFDTMVVGASKRARPYSQISNIDGLWYRFEVFENGKELIATPEDVETGTIKLDFKGAVAPAVVIVKGKDGPLADCWYDITEGGSKGIQVPVGTYELAYGEIRKGKKKQLQKCVILPGKTVPVWGVRRGETTVVELGAPFGLDFATRKEEEKIVVHGRSVRVVGKAGERYERTWNCIVVPEAGFRKKGGKGKAAKYEKMTKPADNEIMNKPGGWDNPWSPLDVVLDTKGQGEVEVQLVLKAHDFFGKIESVWKE